MKKNCPKKLVGAARLVILCAAISVGGWCFEMIVCKAVYGVSGDRGLLRLPVCPIYGISIILIYLILGTPKKSGGVLQRLAKQWEPLQRISEKGGFLRYTVYFLCATAVSTAAELAVGLATLPFEIRLWDYSNRAMNFLGIICLPYSIAWGAMITLLMALLWERAHRAVSRIPQRVSLGIAVALLLLIGTDFITSCISVYLTK